MELSTIQPVSLSLDRLSLFSFFFSCFPSLFPLSLFLSLSSSFIFISNTHTYAFTFIYTCKYIPYTPYAVLLPDPNELSARARNVARYFLSFHLISIFLFSTPIPPLLVSAIILAHSSYFLWCASPGTWLISATVLGIPGHPKSR